MASVAEGLTSDVYRETEFALWFGNLACTDRVSDELLAQSYLRFKKDGLLEQIFYEGVPSLTWFLEHFAKSGKVEILAILRENQDKTLDHVCLGWLNARTSVGSVFDKMEVGFGFFRQYHRDPALIVSATRLMIEFAFRYLHIDAMFGTTPEKNLPAVRMAKRIGFEMHGPVSHFTAWDGAPCGVYISSMSRPRWESIKKSGGEQ